jgi:hypothetical protein
LNIMYVERGTHGCGCHVSKGYLQLHTLLGRSDNQSR